ncbi:hypothetical protein [Salmonella enterica]|uniref:hypothetical protein n=5 Tax=Enterobacteriaceae TaxID=543 RepID=UPI00398C631F
MKVTNKLKLLALGLCMAGTAIAAPDVLNDDAKLKNLENVCPDCQMVAKDVLNLRVENCQLKDTSSAMMIGTMQSDPMWHCCKVSDEAAFCLIQRPYISKTLLTRRISPRGSP